MKETCPASSWGHSRLVMDGPARGQATAHPPPPSHLRHLSVAQEHSISHFQKLWENSPVGHLAFEAELRSLTSTLYRTLPHPRKEGKFSSSPSRLDPYPESGDHHAERAGCKSLSPGQQQQVTQTPRSPALHLVGQALECRSPPPFPLRPPEL